ncbi:phage/plasmid primase, P4 family [Streptomyces globisporus]|uniref:phage/plasmid primase, P4 family n=1 Tax=Streptomyces globisporus TaxID=1908 RepID=UPI0037C95778
MSVHPYRDGVPAYEGWNGVIPVVRETKMPALKGVTGHDGTQPSWDASLRASQDPQWAACNLAIRLDRGLIGIDVDAYDAKRGARTLAELESRLGPLPAAPLSTSRTDGVSGIRLYRAPADAVFRGVAGDDIEIVQHHHRFVMAYPSVHPRTGQMYRWDGCEGTVPRPEEIPDLPAAWVKHLRKVDRPRTPGVGADVDTFTKAHTGASRPDALNGVELLFSAASGSRHDTMLKSLYRAAREAASGLYPASTAFERLAARWEEATAGEGREGEFASMLSAAVASVSPEDVKHTQANPPRATWDESGKLPDPGNPMAVARALMPAWERDGLPTLRHWRGEWMNWSGAHWSELDEGGMRADLYPRVEHAYFETVNSEGEVKQVAWAPTRRKIADLMEAVQAVAHLPSSTDAPSWIGRTGPRTVVACRNGVLDVKTRKLLPSTPAFFNIVSSPLDYDPATPPPAAWLAFLESLWPGDQQAKDALQEWFGYVISGRTDLQKALLLVGAKRSGKGTIARILTALVGKGHVASPTLASMATNFGLSPLIGAPLAIVGDARVPQGGSQTVVERLLSITGEDSLDVDRKYRSVWTGRLPSRFMILSNELPSFADASGAIASRLVILTLTQSFYGKEDTELEGRLLAELPGILLWALDGLDRLSARGRFVQPESSATAEALLSETVSPIRAFLDECCVLGPEHGVERKTLYAAWRDWCTLSGRDHPGTEATFGSKLFSAVPGLGSGRPRQPDGSRPWRYTGVGIEPRPGPGAPRPTGANPFN